MASDPEPVTSKADFVYRQLRRLARQGGLRPRRRLNPQDLDRQFHGGVMPTREALLRLHVEGYVRSESGRGYWTKAVSAAEQRDLQGMLLANLIFCLERGARGAPDDLATAVQALASQTLADPAAEAQVAAQEALLLRIADLADSEILPRLIHNAIDRTHLVRRLDAGDPTRARRTVQDLTALGDAALRDDPVSALAAARRLSERWALAVEDLAAEANRLIAQAAFP